MISQPSAAMNFQIDITSAFPAAPPEAPPLQPSPEMVDLLRQSLDVQREQLACQKTAAQAHDMASRWKAFLARWKDELPDLGDNCRKALPVLERAYANLINELTERLIDPDGDVADNEFTLQEFLDRYGMRIAQMGTLLNLLGPLSDGTATPEPE
jgi:hypothetical protein